MMHNSKKGQETPNWIFITIITALLIFGIVTFVLLSINGASASDKSDSICGASTFVTGQLGNAFQLLPRGISPQDTARLCPTQVVNIVPDAWTKCDAEFKQQFDAGLRTTALKNCAAQQVANLVHRCWNMGGSGSLNPGSWVCFNALIEAPGSIDEADIFEVYDNIVNEVREAIGCTGRLTNSQCRADADAIANLVLNRTSSQAVIDFYTDTVLAGIELCFTEPDEDDEPENTDDTDGDFVVDEFDACPGTPTELVVERGPNGCSAQEVYDEIVSTGQIGASLSGKIDTEKVNCGTGLTSNIQFSLNRIAVYEAQIADLDYQITIALQPYEVASEGVTQRTIELGSRTPGVNGIDKEFLFSLMTDTPIKIDGLASDRTYCQEFPCRETRFDMNIELGSNSIFEIGYCDPPQPVGVGPIARLNCDFDEGGFGRQRILVAPAGEGLSRTRSPVPDLCTYAPFALGTPILRGPAILATGLQASELVLGHDVCEPIVSAIVD